MTAVLLETRGHVALLTLNEPEKRNAMSAAMIDAFPGCVAQAGADANLRALVVTGAGRHFCAGADFTATPDLMRRSGLSGRAAATAAIRSIYGAFLPLLDVPLPTIAAVNGGAIGGGLGIALLCDVRIVADDAKLAANFSRLGIHPGLGITHFLPQCVGPQRAAELLYSGRTIRGEEAAAAGLALESVPAAELLERALAVADAFAKSAPLALRAIAPTLRAARRRGLADVLEREAAAQAALSESEDAREGVVAMMQKREPQFQGK